MLLARRCLITLLLLVWLCGHGPTLPTSAAQDHEPPESKETPMSTTIALGGEPATVAPLDRVSLSIAHLLTPGQTVTVTVTDASGAAYVEKITAHNEFTFTAGGAAGTQTLRVRQGEKTLAELKFNLDAATRVEAPVIGEFFDKLVRTVKGDRGKFQWDGKDVHTNPSWFRDHIHEMKAYRYFEPEVRSFVELMIGVQHEDGFVYDFVVGYDPAKGETAETRWASPRFKVLSDENRRALVRIEIEADLEYLLVEAVDTIWRATGDTAWMTQQIPALEKALRYLMTDPDRWSKEHGLVKRPFTPDTWDFLWAKVGPDDKWQHDPRIKPGTPWGIMHGDNSGLYDALRRLAKMQRAAGDAKRAKELDEEADGLRQRANRLLFNGSFYIHQFLLQPVDTGGPREEEILSLSNPYDINRELPTHAMAVRIIDEYRARRELRRETHFAEWFTLDPPYPRFAAYYPGQYVNGGISSVVAGELSLAAFSHGREAYGADILTRLARKVKEDGKLRFLYTPDGKSQSATWPGIVLGDGGPPGWGAAANIAAIVHGLLGIDDDELLLTGEATIAPRLAATDAGDVRVVLSNAARPEEYVAYHFTHDPETRRVAITFAGSAKLVRWRVLLPPGAQDASVRRDGNATFAALETIKDSTYAAFETPIPAGAGPMELVITY